LGAPSGQILTNGLFSVNGIQHQSKRIAWIHQNSDNDSAAYGSYLAGTNYLQTLCTALRSNGWSIVMSTPISLTNEAAAKTNFVVWLKTSATNYYDVLADASGNTNYGVTTASYGQFTNGMISGFYASDNQHLSPAGITNWMQTVIIPAIYAAANGVSVRNQAFYPQALTVVGPVQGMAFVSASNTWLSATSYLASIMPNFSTAIVASNGPVGPAALWRDYKSNANFYFFQP
jgi:hypothetical protein